MAGGIARATKKRKAMNGMNKKVITTQKKKDGETCKSSKGHTGFLNEDAKKLFETCFCHPPLLVQRVVALGEGKEIEVSPDFISKMLKVLRLLITENTTVFPYKSKDEVPSMEMVIETICDVAIDWVDANIKIYQKDLCLPYRMLNIIFACKINLKRHTTELGYNRAQLLYAIGKGACIDLLHYIFQLILNAYELQDSKQSLPFPILITNIVKPYGVVIEPSESYNDAMGMINEGTMIKSVIHVGPRNHGKIASQLSYSQTEVIIVRKGEGSSVSPVNMNNIGEKLE
ncbi:unnamed protein product [Ilex paraguariensis]|uniref:Putative plant transposon protein domain-containing protein n=1 Tax=Ilex paraguariensis TaxID=185542 RepID=A0ABC8SGT2_9AQUA